MPQDFIPSLSGMKDIKSLCHEYKNNNNKDTNFFINEDWIYEPEFIHHLKDFHLRNLAFQINQYWVNLIQNFEYFETEDVFLVPWYEILVIVKGLLTTDNNNGVVKNIIRKLATSISSIGYAPRSSSSPDIVAEPPFLSLLLKEYLNKTIDIHFLRQNMIALETELNFWKQNRLTRLKESSLYSYQENKDSNESRNEGPESMKTPWNQVSDCLTISSFSKGSRIYPVELNSLLYVTCNNMGEFYALLGDTEKSESHYQESKELKADFQKTFWNKEFSNWFDVHLEVNSTYSQQVFPSNYLPLWAKCYDENEDLDSILLTIFHQKHIFMNSYETNISFNELSIPTLLPIIISGLVETDNVFAKQLGLDLAKDFLKTFESSYSESTINYNNQQSSYDGFAWIHGFIGSLLNTFGDELNTLRKSFHSSSSSFSYLKSQKSFQRDIHEKHEFERSEKVDERIKVQEEKKETTKGLCVSLPENSIRSEYDELNVECFLRTSFLKDLVFDKSISQVKDLQRSTSQVSGPLVEKQGRSTRSQVSKTIPLKLSSLKELKGRNANLKTLTFDIDEDDAESESMEIVVSQSLYPDVKPCLPVSSNVYIVQENLRIINQKGSLLNLRLDLEVEVEDSLSSSYFCTFWPFCRKGKQMDGELSSVTLHY